MCGDADALMPPECSREIAAAVPHARCVEPGECGHMLTWERPAEVKAALLDGSR